MEYNYTHGGDVYRNPIEYDFSVNLNPLGMPLASIQAAHEGIVLTGRYPDYRAEQLCRAIAKAKNIKVEYLEKFEEKPRNLILSRRVGTYSNSMEEIVADMQFEYLREKADSGESFVVVGRCAETVLGEYPGLISFFVLGDKDVKLKNVMKHFGLNDAEAKAKIKRHDIKRKMYHNRHSDFKWGDSRNYDICINSSKLGLEKTAEILEEYVKQRM